MIRTGLELNRFNIFSESNEPLNVTELAVKTGAVPTLTGEFHKFQSEYIHQFLL
jgi:hypothetical protein